MAHCRVVTTSSYPAVAPCRTPPPPFAARIVLCMVLALGVVVGCSSDDGSPTSATTSTAASSASPGDPTEPEGPAAPPFAVGRADLVLVDPSRPTAAVEPAGLEARDDRTVELSVFYPAEGEPGERAEVLTEWDHSGALPVESVAEVGAAPAAGPFPLLVFAHGFIGQGSSFVALAEQWAREGYVVALPTFPLSRMGVGVLDDYVNQPGDLSFVIDRLTGSDETGEVPAELEGLVDADRIALGGHSLGAATVFRAGYNECCVDDRVKVTVTVAGGPLDAGDGGYEDQPDTPMLLIHGAADAAVDVAIGDSMVDFVQAPVTYLRFDAGDHVSVFVADEGELLSDAVLAFLNAHLRGDTTGLDRLPDEVEASGIAELRNG